MARTRVPLATNNQHSFVADFDPKMGTWKGGIKRRGDDQPGNLDGWSFRQTPLITTY